MRGGPDRATGAALDRLRTVLGGRPASSLRRLAVAWLLVVGVFAALNPSVFLSVSNLQFIALSTPELAVLSIAIALTMLTGGIDLSVVGIANLSAVACALVLVGTDGSLPWLLAGLAVAMAVAAGCGLLNGLVVATGRVTPILATLATSQLFLGLALVLTRGTVIKGLPERFTGLALTTVAGVPVVFLLAVAVTAVTALLVARTPLGVRMRLLGANRTAADYAGVRSARVLVVTYVASGLLAGVAGLVISSRASGANSEYGLSYILLAIIVAVLAGVDPDGGRLDVPAVLLAALTMQTLGAGLLSIAVSSHVISIAQGVLLVVVMAVTNRLLPWWAARTGRLPPTSAERRREAPG